MTIQDDENQEGKTGQGGKSGEKGFRIQQETSRDDLLTPKQLKLHQEINKAYVEKQKILRKERAAIKEGRNDVVAQLRAARGLGMGSGGSSSPFKKHPISDKAQFSGIDKQISGIPTLNETNTNDEKRNELENRYNLTHQPKRTFNPRPSPYGSG